MNHFIKLLFLFSFLQISLQQDFTGGGNYFILTRYFRGNATYQLISNSGSILLVKTINPFNPAATYVDPQSFFRIENQDGDVTLNKPAQDWRICVFVKQASWGRGYVRFEREDPNFMNDPNCGWIINATTTDSVYTIKNRQLGCYLAFQISDFGMKNTQVECALFKTNSSKYSFNWNVLSV